MQGKKPASEIVMSKQSKYALKSYIKAVELHAQLRGFSIVHKEGKKGSAYRFELFQNKDDTIPCAIWNVHYSHDKKRELWSDDDIEKAAKYIGVNISNFIETLKKFK